MKFWKYTVQRSTGTDLELQAVPAFEQGRSRNTLSCWDRRTAWQNAATTVVLCAACLSRWSFAQPSLEAYDISLRAAQEALKVHRYSAAKAELETAIAIDPLRADGWAELGELYGHISDFRSAETVLRHSLQLDPASASTHYLLGLALIANPKDKMDWPAAILEFREALKLKPDYLDAMNYLGVGLMTLGQTAEAITTLKHVVEMDPHRPEPHFNLALALESRGDLDLAADQYRIAIVEKPNYSEAESALGKLLLRQGRVDEADSQLRDALRIIPDLQDAHYALGRALRKMKKVEQAQIEFDEAVALGQRTPNGIESSQLSNGALGRAAKGDLPGAEADLRRAIRLRPDYGVPHYNLGLILADEQHMEEAARQLLQAISLMPGRAQPWIDLAKVQSRQGDVKGAQASLMWALQIAPKDERAQAELRSLAAAPLTTAPTFVLGAVPWTKAPADAVDTAANHNRYAGQLQSQGDCLGASGEWLRSLTLVPDAVPVRLALANCLEHMGEGSLAILEERKALFVTPADPAAHLALGLSLMNAGLAAEAREQLKQTLVLDPASVPAAAALKRLVP